MPAKDKRKPHPKQGRLDKTSSNIVPQLSRGFQSALLPNLSEQSLNNRSFQTPNKNAHLVSRNNICDTNPNQTSNRTFKSDARQSRVVSNQADSSNIESWRESKIPPKIEKSRRTMSVQDLYRADMEAYDVDQQPQVHSSTQRSFIKPNKMSIFSEEPIEDKPAYDRSNVDTDKIEIIFEDSLYENSQEVENQPKTPPKYPPFSEQKRKSREKVAPRPADEIMAAKLRGLRFYKFKDIALKGRIKLIYTAFFEEMKTPRKKELEFITEQLNFLSKALGRNLRTEFLKEYLITHTPRT